MTPLIAFGITLGLLFRAVVLTAMEFKPKDILTLGGSIITSLLSAGRLAGEEGWIWMAMPIFCAAVLAMGYKDRLMIKVNESIVLLYGLFGSYLMGEVVFSLNRELSILSLTNFIWTIVFIVISLLVFHFISRAAPIVATILVTIYGFVIVLPIMVGMDIWLPVLVYLGILFSLCYVLLSILLVFTSIRLNQFQQTITAAFFVAMSTFLFVAVSYQMFTVALTQYEAVLLGFIALPFLAGITYLVYFIPVTLNKTQTIAMRKADIKQHAHDLAGSYFDQDTPLSKGITVLVLFGVFIGLKHFSLVAEPLLLSLLITFALAILGPSQIGAFTPRRIKEII